MSELSVLSNAQTMSSLEIAEMTEKRHDHVLGDIRRILSEVEISSTLFEGVYKDQQLIDRPCFNLPRRECDLVIAGYSAKYRLAIIDRWHELESQQPKISYCEALRRLADNIEALELAESNVKVLKIELDLSHEFSTIKRFASHNSLDWKELSWKKLVGAMGVLGMKVNKVFDGNYGSVNSYHIDAFAMIYPDMEFPI